MAQVKLARPIHGDITKCRLNRTLHGRSHYRVQNVSGHNCIKGFNSPGTGDALDIFQPKGTEIFAVCSGQIATMRDVGGKLSCLYLDGVQTGHEITAVYAHCKYKDGIEPGAHVKAGECIGWIDDEVSDPHLHFELWLDGRAISEPTAFKLAKRMAGYFVD